MSAVTADALADLIELEGEYRAAQAAVVEAVQAATDAIEQAVALRGRYVELHARCLKLGEDVPPRVQYGVLPGGTNPDGLRERWLRAAGARW